MKRSEFLKVLENQYGILHRGGWSELSEDARFDQILNWMSKHLPLNFEDEDPNYHECSHPDCKYYKGGL